MTSFTQEHRAAVERLQVTLICVTSHMLHSCMFAVTGGSKLLHLRIGAHAWRHALQAELQSLKEQHGGNMHVRKATESGTAPFPLAVTVTVPQPPVAANYDCDSLKVCLSMVSTAPLCCPDERAHA